MNKSEPRWVMTEEMPWVRAKKEHLQALLRDRLTRRELVKYGGLTGMSLSDGRTP